MGVPKKTRLARLRVEGRAGKLDRQGARTVLCVNKFPNAQKRWAKGRTRKCSASASRRGRGGHDAGCASVAPFTAVARASFSGTRAVLRPLIARTIAPTTTTTSAGAAVATSAGTTTAGSREFVRWRVGRRKWTWTFANVDRWLKIEKNYFFWKQNAEKYDLILAKILTDTPFSKNDVKSWRADITNIVIFENHTDVPQLKWPTVYRDFTRGLLRPFQVFCSARVSSSLRWFARIDLQWTDT